jgi:hypothetical protein
MQVFDVYQDGFQLTACVVFGVEEPHPHVMGMMVNDEQAVAEAMWGGDTNMTPNVSGHVEKGTGWFRASGGAAWCTSDLVEHA